MIVSKDIDPIIWRFIHSSIMKSLNTEYSYLTRRVCEDYSDCSCACARGGICTYGIIYRKAEHNYRTWSTGLIYDLKCNRTAKLPDNY